MASLDRRRIDRSLTCPWRIIAALIGLMLLLSLVARGSGTLALDARTTAFVQDLDGPVFSAFAAIGNAIGYFRIALPLWALAAIATAASRRWRELAFLIVLLALRGAATVLKAIFDSPRPTAEIAELVGMYEGLGFPSGHSMTASVTVGGMAFVALRMFHSRGARYGLAVVWIVCVTLTAFARIWVGAHWLTDTVGGTLVGATIVLVSANLSALIDARRTATHRSTMAPNSG